MEEAGRAPVVPWGRNNTLVSFPPAHTERPHFPTSLAISRGYVIEFWPLGCRKKRSVSLLDLAPKIFCTVLNILSPETQMVEPFRLKDPELSYDHKEQAMLEHE